MTFRYDFLQVTLNDRKVFERCNTTHPIKSFSSLTKAINCVLAAQFMFATKGIRKINFRRAGCLTLLFKSPVEFILGNFLTTLRAVNVRIIFLFVWAKMTELLKSLAYTKKASSSPRQTIFTIRVGAALTREQKPTNGSKVSVADSASVVRAHG